MLNVLIVSGGGFQGSTLVKGLQVSNYISVVIVDCFAENVCKYEICKYYQVPLLKDNELFICRLLEIIDKEKISIVFPATELELLLLAKNKEKIEKKKCKLAISDSNILNILINKKRVYSFLSDNNFSVLKAINISDTKIKFPIIGKPELGFGSQGVVVIDNYEEFNKYINNNRVNNYIWQPYIKKFQEFSIDFAIGFDYRSSPVIIRKRLKTSGGFSIISEREKDSSILSEINRFIDIIIKKGACGIFNVQVLKDRKNKIYFSDVNPRVGTSSVFSLGLNINLPLFMCSYFNKQAYLSTISDQYNSYSVKMIRSLKEKWIYKYVESEIKAVVFDLDDTLINQKKWVYDKLELLHWAFELHFPNKEIFMANALCILEEGNRSLLIDEILKYYKLQNNKSIRNNMIEFYRKSEPEKIFIYRDVFETIKTIKKAGLKLAILTDNPVSSQKQKINKMKISKMFDEIIYSRELAKEKPHEKVFHEVSNRLNIDCKNLVMVGDNLLRDCHGSINAGYALSFYIARKGTFFNFNFDLFLENNPSTLHKILKIDSLNDICHSLVNYL